MDTDEQALDQRKSFRCPVPESQRNADLRIRRRRVPVRLFNESSGGFGALAAIHPDVAAGEVVTLVTAVGEFEVRVAYVRDYEPQPDEPAPKKPLFRIGLERVRDMAEAPAGQSLRHVGKVHHGLHVSGMGLTISLVICLIAAVAGALTILANVNSPWIRQFARWQKSAPLGDPDSQSLETVVRDVGLTRVQQTRMQEIAETTAKALQDLDEAWKNDAPQERVVKQQILLEAAKREVLRLLTPEQRARWKTLVE